MFSSFSSSYSYVSDGKNEKIEKHNRIKNNKNDIGFGTQELRNKEKKLIKRIFIKYLMIRHYMEQQIMISNIRFRNVKIIRK